MSDTHIPQMPDASSDTLVLKLGYRGADFAGFAFQPQQRTVEGELIRALETFLHRPIELVCAGRTDAGVHAQAQYVSLGVYPSELAIPKRRLLRSLNALVSDDVSIQQIYRADKDFSARFDACERTYCYRICAAESRPVLSWDNAWWYRGQLNVERMQEAANYLIGEHDFTTFCKVASAKELSEKGLSLSRCIKQITLQQTQEAYESQIQIFITGNAFLHSMVRNIVGSLVEVGRGKREPLWVKEILEAKNRTRAGICAPAKGLTLHAVTYQAGALYDWR